MRSNSITYSLLTALILSFVWTTETYADLMKDSWLRLNGRVVDIINSERIMLFQPADDP